MLVGMHGGANSLHHKPEAREKEKKSGVYKSLREHISRPEDLTLVPNARLYRFLSMPPREPGLQHMVLWKTISKL